MTNYEIQFIGFRNMDIDTVEIAIGRRIKANEMYRVVIEGENSFEIEGKDLLDAIRRLVNKETCLRVEGPIR